MKKKLLFIINPKAGVKSKTTLPTLIHNTINHAEYQAHIQFTEYAGHAQVLAQHAVEKNFDAIVVAGGDGSVNEVGRVLTGSPVAMGIIPSGSGNGLARSLKIPLKPKQAIEIINNYNVQKIDVGSINNQLFFSNAGVGLEARVVNIFDKTPKRGFIEYTRIGFQQLKNYKGCTFQLELDGKIIYSQTQPIFVINFTNSGQYGYDMGIAPEQSNLFDGYMECCVFTDFNRLKVPYFALLLMLKKYKYIPNIKIFKFKTAKVKVIDTHLFENDVQIDGEPFFKHFKNQTHETFKMAKKVDTQSTPSLLAFDIQVLPQKLNAILP